MSKPYALSPTPYMVAALHALITPADQPHRRTVVRAGSSLGKTSTLLFTSGARDALMAEASDRRYFVVERAARATSGRVVPARHPTPPVGTPAAGRHGGNSPPAIANVRGSQKSERTGERTTLEVNGLRPLARGE